jgi:hypothetical protein
MTVITSRSSGRPTRPPRTMTSRDGSRPSPTTARSPTGPSVSPTAALLARDPDGTLAEFVENTPRLADAKPATDAIASFAAPVR